MKNTDWEADDAKHPYLVLVHDHRRPSSNQPGRTRRGVLEITVRNSTIMQELVFQKTELIQTLTDRLPEAKISDLRFRVGVVD